MSGPKQPEGSRERFSLVYDNASLTADLTVVLDAPPKRYYVESARYYNATGLATDATDYFDVQVLIGATIAANWSTETDEEGSLTAGAFETLTNAAAASRVGDAGDKISAKFDETGTATLPAGRLVIDCVYY